VTARSPANRRQEVLQIAVGAATETAMVHMNEPSVHRLRIPDDAANHNYRLTLSMHPFDSEEWLPLLNEQGGDTGDMVILTLIPVVGDWDPLTRIAYHANNVSPGDSSSVTCADSLPCC
jgi:hypothetical protein